MKRTRWAVFFAAAILLGGVVAAQKEDAKRAPGKFELACAAGDCPLLKGAPQTSGMRGGSVKLKPGESVGWHSTGENEEALVILKGSGAARIEGRPDIGFHDGELIYIPSGKRHNVTNTGADVLEYVWVVAPTR